MREKIQREELLSFLAFFFLLVLLRFRIDHGAGGGVDVDFRDIPIRAENLDFPDGLAMFLFELRLDDRPWHFLGRGLDGLIDRDLGVLDEVRNLRFLVVRPGAGADGE